VEEAGVVSLLSECDDDELPALPTATASNWRVNGIANGSTSVGTLLASGFDATYKAPATAPANNPVAVSVEYSPKPPAKQLLISNITVTDGIARTWTGTSQILIPHRDSVLANVTWTRNPQRDQGNIIYYEPSGTVEHHSLLLEEAGCTVTPTSFTIVSDAVTYLVVEYGFNPPRFLGVADLPPVSLTLTCPGAPPITQPGSFRWFSGNGTVSADGRKIEGGTATSGETSSYTFTRDDP
jgi:hypothetical protein